MQMTINKILKKSFYIIFLCLFSYLVINIPIKRVSVYHEINPSIYILVSLLILIVWFILYKLTSKVFEKISKRKKIILYIITLTLIFSIQILVAFILDVPLGWDFKFIYTQARDFVMERVPISMSGNPYYFQYFPNNIFLYCILVILFSIGKLINITDFICIGVTVNIIIIFLTILFTFLYIQKKFGNKNAYFSLITFLFFIPLFLYIPIFYSDTFSIIFIPLLLYISTFFEEDSKIKRIIAYCIFGILTFIGYKIKMTVIFIPLSIIISNFLSKNYKVMITTSISIAVSILTFGSLFSHIFIEKDILHIKIDDYGSIPYTHWIMMGIEDKDYDNSGRNSYGGYNYDDYLKTQSFTTNKEASKFHIKEIGNRIKKYGIIGYLNYLTKKAVNAWGDGNYFAAIKLKWENYNSGSLQKIISGNDNYHIMIYLNCAVQFAFLLLLIYSFARSIKRKDDNLIVIQLSISMLFIFLLFWENRSRYLYNYIPLFVIIVTNGVEKINQYYINYIKEKNKGVKYARK